MSQPIWNTAAGTLGSYPTRIPLEVQLSASPQFPATSLIYNLLSGSLPPGLIISVTGLIYGIPLLVTTDTSSTFTIRVTDDLNNIRDRTFSMTISGSAIPKFTTPTGSLLNTQDSIWTDLHINYSNIDVTNQVIVRLKEGILPPGLEINTAGIIRGYPLPPTASVTLSEVTTLSTVTTSTQNIIVCSSTTGFSVGRPVIFTGTVFGGIVSGTTYYIKSIESAISFTISSTQYGNIFSVVDGTGSMTTTLTTTSVGMPTIRTYSFTLELVSDLGGDTAAYSITVINQNTPISQGGPGKLANSRSPTLLNTRPLTFNLVNSDPYYGYYLLPPVTPTQIAQIGTVQSGDYFAFNIIGHDFDNNVIQYTYSNLPLGLIGNSTTGWITGTPVLTSTGISSYSFTVSAYKVNSPTITTGNFKFGLNVSNQINGVITWITPANLGIIFNGTISTLSVLADSDVDLSYRITSGNLPTNLELLSNGEIIGRVSNQPTSEFLVQGDTTLFTFTVQAYSFAYSIVQSSKTFVMTVLQEYQQPTDILYIKAAPSISDRNLIDSLLTNETIIPNDDIYRIDDIYFGKASSVIYEHAYGIYASDITSYLAAVTKNHYWRNIVLGELKTAIAKNAAGDVIYEVVYSEVIDNLVNPDGISINSRIYWDNLIDLGLGPWYTSITDIYTSYDFEVNGLPTYYTSLTPGYARVLYPNSLYNMRNRVSEVIGQEYDSRLLPQWMTSQQPNGSTLGYTQAWVICYTKPGRADKIKSNIETMWPNTLNQINVGIDRFTVDKSATFDYDKHMHPAAWTNLPSSVPTPDPLDSKDFYVLFPRKTILPDETQY